ncbi:ipis-1-like [Dermacentor andersoni]|uniref:ipis-1-like n=1 Tax=Dermacentor andersoni TaxID=34620 RepID=UPI002155BBB5|nr:leukocyte elastase inhibitor A-like [Dermacentor andersoni]
MYTQLQSQNEGGENLIFSPFGIAVALTMALTGARNNTAEELASLLHVKDHQDKGHDHFPQFLNNLSQFAPDVEFYVANRIYSGQQFRVHRSYRSHLENSYGATIRTVDFKKGHEAVRLEANAWISQQTVSKIRDLLPPGSVDAGTALILLNAVYFKGFWKSPFRAADTAPRNFHLDSRNTVRVDTMFQHSESYRLGSSNELRARALEIPYRGGTMSMVILLPDGIEGLPFLERQLSWERLSSLLRCLKRSNNVQLSLPKLKLEQRHVLNDVLKALGAVDLFTPGVADLSGMFQDARPAVSDIVHKTFLQVDEEGTEAVNAAAIMLRSTLRKWRPAHFTVDHPFMFIIKSKEPDVILFIGSVRRP